MKALYWTVEWLCRIYIAGFFLAIAVMMIPFAVLESLFCPRQRGYWE